MVGPILLLWLGYLMQPFFSICHCTGEVPNYQPVENGQSPIEPFGQKEKVTPVYPQLQ